MTKNQAIMAVINTFNGFNYEIGANSINDATRSFKVLRALGVSNRDIQKAIAEENEMWKRAKMPVTHRELPDGRKVLRGSVEEWVEMNE